MTRLDFFGILHFAMAFGRDFRRDLAAFSGQQRARKTIAEQSLWVWSVRLVSLAIRGT
jgi:hypothetical protein